MVHSDLAAEPDQNRRRILERQGEAGFEVRVDFVRGVAQKSSQEARIDRGDGGVFVGELDKISVRISCLHITHLRITHGSKLSALSFQRSAFSQRAAAKTDLADC